MRALLVLAIVVLVSSSAAMRMLRPTSATHSSGRHTAPSWAPTSIRSVSTASTLDSGVLRAGNGCGFSLGAALSTEPVGRCTVLEVGDSLGNDLGWGLSRELSSNAGINLVQLDQSATGLANTGYYDWPAELKAELQMYHPQLVLVCLGGNDEQGIEADGSAVQFPTPAWKGEYLDRVRQLVGEAVATGAFVLWVGLPIMEQPSYSDGIQTLDELYQSAVASIPSATFFSTWSLFANSDGAFQSSAFVNHVPGDLRQSDGIHFSVKGEDVIATYVIEAMSAIYHVTLVPDDPALVTNW